MSTGLLDLTEGKTVNDSWARCEAPIDGGNIATGGNTITSPSIKGRIRFPVRTCGVYLLAGQFGFLLAFLRADLVQEIRRDRRPANPSSTDRCLIYLLSTPLRTLSIGEELRPWITQAQASKQPFSA